MRLFVIMTLLITTLSASAQVYILRPKYAYACNYFISMGQRDHSFERISNFATDITIDLSKRTIVCLDANFAASERITGIEADKYNKTFRIYTNYKKNKELALEYWELKLDQSRIPVSLTKRTVKKEMEKDTSYVSYHAEFPPFAFTMMMGKEKHMGDEENTFGVDINGFYNQIRKIPEAVSYNKIVVRPDTVYWQYYAKPTDLKPVWERTLVINKDDCHIFDADGVKQIAIKCFDINATNFTYQFYIGRVNAIDPGKDVAIAIVTGPEDKQEVTIMTPY